MDLSVSLEMDSKFRDFNLCVYLEPSLDPRGTFPESRLLQAAYRIRKGDAGDLAEFADALARTIRRETFEAFQKIHGPRPISYSDWYCTKLEQFFGILYERLMVRGLGPHGGLGPPQTDRPWEEGDRILCAEHGLVQKDAIDRAFSPHDLKRIDWIEVVGQLADAGPRGLQVLEGWLARRAARRKRGAPGQVTRSSRKGPGKREASGRGVSRH